MYYKCLKWSPYLTLCLLVHPEASISQLWWQLQCRSSICLCLLLGRFSQSRQASSRVASRHIVSYLPTSMPEIRECIAHFLHFQYVYNKLKSQETNFTLLNLWADAKDGKGPGKFSDEEKKYNATDGKVMCLNSSCTIRRGTNHRQTPIWPSQCHPEAEEAIPLTSLELKGAQGTARTIHLDFGALWLSVSCHILRSKSNAVLRIF